MQEIIITESQKKTLSNHADNEKPNESCAILFGMTSGKKNTVKEVFLTKNIDESPVNFTISNEQLIQAYNMAEEKKMEVIGIFHSHPNSETYPSVTDKKFMCSNPVVWLIYSGLTNDFKAYVLELDILEIPIRVQKLRL
ncbi:MAG: Mov34/MPN/PAD-1 family protein [Nitrosarchaeum sp.]|nr:Mov34/MPN/PAD-1 family protein [Nitrosarchaeum sp.]